jgi:hypothetical protein
MRFISHRGNLNGKDIKNENKPKIVDHAINLGFECEIDIWYTDGKLFLGHDFPQIYIEDNYIFDRVNHLWIHCKNIQALTWCKSIKNKKLNFFWHESDLVTLTSLGNIWAFPGKQPIENSIAVMPEIHDDQNLEKCFGICSDVIIDYKKLYEKV